MKVIDSNLDFNYISDLSLNDYDYLLSDLHILIAKSSYEGRSTHFFKTNNSNIEKYDNSFIFSFKDHVDIFDRAKNDALYETSLHTKLREYDSDESEKVLKDLKNFIYEIRKSTNKALVIDIDITSMPTRIYCALPIMISSLIKEGDRIHIHYSVGKYNIEEHTTVGISEFECFSGQLSLSPINRTHIIGLGFDSIRTSGIIDIFDPRFLISYFTKPAAKSEYEKCIEHVNSSILENSDLSFTVPYNNAEAIISQLISVCKEALGFSDVCLIPDGPKHIILLSSLIPDILNTRGIVCFHTLPNEEKRIPKYNILPLGEIVSFSFEKRPCSNK